MRTSLAICVLLLVTTLAVAAPPDGTWNLQGSVAGAPQQLVLTVSGGSLTGTVDGVAISNGTAQNATVHFQAVRSGVTYLYKATVMSNGSLVLTEEQNGQARQLTYVHPN